MHEVRPSPRSLVLDLLSTLRRGAMPVRALVEAGGLFGLGPGAVRVALARLLAEGLVARDERGLYRLGEGAGAIGAKIASWRDPAARMRGWSGAWIGVLSPRAAAQRGARTPTARRRGERALRMLGFRALEPGLALRPDNLADGVRGARSALAGLGLDAGARVFQLGELDPATEARARSLWDVPALDRAARDACAALARSERRLARAHGPAAHAAMRESFLVGGHAIRALTLDPLLPEAIQSPDARDRLVAAMRRYDRLGRAAWAGFLHEHGVPHARGAVDLGVAEAADTLSAAAGAR